MKFLFCRLPSTPFQPTACRLQSLFIFILILISFSHIPYPIFQIKARPPLLTLLVSKPKLTAVLSLDGIREGRENRPQLRCGIG